MGHITRWAGWSAAGVAALLFVPIVSVASDAYIRYEAKVNQVCGGKIFPTYQLFSTSPYNVKGKCYALYPTRVSQLVSRHAEMVQGNALMLIFNRQEKYPNIPYSVVVGVGAFRYTDAGGAIRVIPEVGYLSAYVENPAIIKLQAEANAEEQAKQAKEQAKQAKQAAEAAQLRIYDHSIRHSVRHYIQYGLGLVGFGQSLYCQVSIELSPQGQLEGEPAIIQSSGSAQFDSAIIASIEESAPFPPPTGLSYSEFKKQVLEFSPY
ncbi:MAG: cell envelope integrity protein TolA [Gammaproteobacteria bacterium]|nr:cell envelope integrity protein TolA [Gammaproteobacteria bacterium]